MDDSGDSSLTKTCYQFHRIGGREVDVDKRRSSENPVQRVAGTIAAWKVICGLIVALVAAVVSATIYVSGFATTEAVQGTISRHESSDGHPSLSSGMRSISDRLLRVEITQGAMVETQKSMDQKLDRILNVIPLVRQPVYQPSVQPDP